MPHDRNGNVVEVGDIVYVECFVRHVTLNSDFCNVGLETTAPMYPTTTGSVMSLNATQVMKPLLGYSNGAV